MEFGEGNGSRAAGPDDVNDGLERGERDTHVGRMCRDARLACAEYRVDAITPLDAEQPLPGSRLLQGVAVS